MSEPPIHATTVAHFGPGGWQAVILLGPSGAGKSDLGLRLIGRGWRLVSDDYTLVWASAGQLYTRAPNTIEGRMEARGVGIISTKVCDLARAVLAVACVPEAEERMPEPQWRRFAGIDLPLIALDPRHASAADKVAAAIRTL